MQFCIACTRRQSDASVCHKHRFLDVQNLMNTCNSRLNMLRCRKHPHHTLQSAPGLFKTTHKLFLAKQPFQQEFAGNQKKAILEPR